MADNHLDVGSVCVVMYNSGTRYNNNVHTDVLACTLILAGSLLLAGRYIALYLQVV